MNGAAVRAARLYSSFFSVGCRIFLNLCSSRCWIIFCTYNNSMQIIFDIVKRDKTLLERGLDFADANAVFACRHLTAEDLRHDYGERRFITVGMLLERLVVLVFGHRAARLAASFP